VPDTLGVTVELRLKETVRDLDGLPVGVRVRVGVGESENVCVDERLDVPVYDLESERGDGERVVVQLTLTVSERVHERLLVTTGVPVPVLVGVRLEVGVAWVAEQVDNDWDTDGEVDAEPREHEPVVCDGEGLKVSEKVSVQVADPVPEAENVWVWLCVVLLD